MSNRPQPTPKQNFIQILLITSVFFLGMQLFNTNRQQPVDPRTPEMVLGTPENTATQEPPIPKEGELRDPMKGTMYWADSKLYWYTLQQINNTIYQQKVKDVAEAQKKGVKDPGILKQIDDETQFKLLSGDILVADAQYKFAITRKSTAAMRNAFNTIQSWERKMQGSPLWDREVPIPPTQLEPERFPWRQLSGHELYTMLVSDISTRNRQELVYGVIPGYKIIDGLVNLTGGVSGFSYAFAAFLLALIVRVAVFPVAQKQLVISRKMQQLAPLLKEIREEFTDKKTKQVTNQVELNQRTMALYAEYGLNPFAGCVPAMIQFPLFITVYQCMLQYQFAFQKGTFLWVNPATSAATHGFLAPTLGDRDYVLIVLYGITMVISTLLMPISDPSQIKQQRLMGIGFGLLFTFMMFTGAFPTPAAFVLYWVFTNLFATAQSLRAYRMPMPPLQKVNTKTGGVFPMPPFSTKSPSEGTTNGKTTIQMPKSTGTPAKHKPKKRK